MSDKILAHHQRWQDLPVFPPLTALSDDDVNAWGDTLYMRSLVDDIIAHRGFRIDDALNAIDQAEDRAAAWVPATDELLLDWPKDQAAQLLAEWQS